MKHYRSQTSNVVAAMGFTDLFVLTAADITGTNAVTVTLDALAAGDVVLTPVLVEVVTAVTGPSGSPTIVIEGGSTALTGTAVITGTNRTISGASHTYYVGASDNLEAVFAAGGGDGAAATAGEIRIWCSISRAADRARVSA